MTKGISYTTPQLEHVLETRTNTYKYHVYLFVLNSNVLHMRTETTRASILGVSHPNSCLALHSLCSPLLAQFQHRHRARRGPVKVLVALRRFIGENPLEMVAAPYDPVVARPSWAKGSGPSPSG